MSNLKKPINSWVFPDPIPCAGLLWTEVNISHLPHKHMTICWTRVWKSETPDSEQLLISSVFGKNHYSWFSKYLPQCLLSKFSNPMFNINLLELNLVIYNISLMSLLVKLRKIERRLISEIHIQMKNLNSKTKYMLMPTTKSFI